jgi:hypothetical protein
MTLFRKTNGGVSKNETPYFGNEKEITKGYNKE